MPQLLRRHFCTLLAGISKMDPPFLGHYEHLAACNEDIYYSFRKGFAVPSKSDTSTFSVQLKKTVFDSKIKIDFCRYWCYQN